MEETKLKIISKTLEYIKIIKEEYPFLNIEVPSNFEDYFHIEDTGTITVFVRNKHFYFPLEAVSIIDKMKKTPGYGINNKHTCFNETNLIENNNTFITYINHIHLKGMSAEEYYLEILLHETMHFCGSAGAYALNEGFTELKTRELALKHNLVTNGCWYPKEIKLALEFQDLFGKDICDQLTFIIELEDKLKFIKENVSEEAANLFEEVFKKSTVEFYNKYYKKDFGGLTGPVKKAYHYSRINYDDIYLLFDEYKNNNQMTK